MIDWRHWHNEPFLVGGLVFAGWLWAILAGPWRERLAASNATSTIPPFPRGAATCFYSGLLVFYLAVGSPLDQVGESYLFSVHMLQHQLLIYPAAILVLLGLPDWMLDAVLARQPWRALVRFLTRPVIAALIYLLVIGLWHAPWLYDRALRFKVLHVFEHLSFFGAAVLYWWPILSRSRVVPRAGYGTQMLFVLAVIIGLMPIHAYITFSHDILYPTYEYAPRLFANFTPANDQLLAGVAMQLVALAVSLGTIGVAFYRWHRES